MTVPPDFYCQTVGMEYLIICLGILFGFSLYQLTDILIGTCGMFGFMSVFISIEKWNNPRTQIPVWRRS
ncbi:MAG: hypothetical protein WC455_21720 [Dehalococcoidia bacterium]